MANRRRPPASQKRQPRSPRSPGRQGRQGSTGAPRPPATGLRRRVQQRSAPVLVTLTRAPRLLVPAVMGVLVVVALAAPTFAAAPALVVVLVFVGWLTYLSWPAITPTARVVRVLVLVVLAGYGIGRLQGWAP